MNQNLVKHLTNVAVIAVGVAVGFAVYNGVTPMVKKFHSKPLEVEEV